MKKLLVGKEYKDMFGNAIKEIITDAEKNKCIYWWLDGIPS